MDFPKSGTSYLYFRTYAKEKTENGCHLFLDGKQLTVDSYAAIYFYKHDGWAWNGQWQYAGEGLHEGPVALSIASAGKHTIGVGVRDIGLKLDQLLVTSELLPPGEFSGTSPLQILEDAIKPIPVAGTIAVHAFLIFPHRADSPYYRVKDFKSMDSRSNWWVDICHGGWTDLTGRNIQP